MLNLYYMKNMNWSTWQKVFLVGMILGILAFSVGLDLIGEIH
jgi:hypothetical protein